MIMSAKDLVANVGELVALPDICFRINEMVEDPGVSAAQISAVISQDPSLSAQLLKIANSPFYGFPSRVETISRALMVVGTNEVRDMVLATTIINSFSQYRSEVFDMEQFWHHSLMTGLMARQLSYHTSTVVLHKDRLFIAGLLHNIGQLVMAMRIDFMVNQLVKNASIGKLDATKIEQEVFDLDHGEVGAELMRSWQLPVSLVEVAEFHHRPEQAVFNPLDVAIVNIASAAVSREIAEDNPHFSGHDVSDQAWAMTGLDLDKVGTCLEKVLGEYLGIESAFLTAQ